MKTSLEFFPIQMCFVRVTLKGREITASRGIPNVVVVRLCPPKCLGISASLLLCVKEVCKHTKKRTIYLFVL